MDTSIIITTIVVQIVTFGVLALILHRFMYSAYKGELTRLQDLSLEYKNKAEQLAEDMRKAEDAHRARVEEAEAEIRELRNSIQAEAGKQREEVLLRARSESDRIISAAMGVKDRVRKELEEDIARKSVEFACDLIQGVMSADNMKWFHQGLVKEIIAAIGRVDAKRFQSIEGENMVLVRSPYNLDAAHEKDLEKIIGDKLGRQVLVKQFTDEAVIAGITVKLGSLVIDGSLAGQLKQTALKLRNK